MPDLTPSEQHAQARCQPISPAELGARVETTRVLLERMHGAELAPFGGWRNRAVEAVAKRTGMNPYALDRIIRHH